MEIIIAIALVIVFLLILPFLFGVLDWYFGPYMDWVKNLTKKKKNDEESI